MLLKVWTFEEEIKEVKLYRAQMLELNCYDLWNEKFIENLNIQIYTGLKCDNFLKKQIIENFNNQKVR